MLKYFSTLYAGHVLEGDGIGFDGQPANDRWYSNERCAYAFEIAKETAQSLEDCGYDILWMAEHHFQREGYECIPNLLMLSVVVYSTAADNSISAKIHYNALSSPPSAGALPWCRLSFSTTSGLWLWCAFSSCSARCGPVMPVPVASRSFPRSHPGPRAPRHPSRLPA